MNPGDKAKVVSSPYSSVPRGTVATVLKVRKNHMPIIKNGAVVRYLNLVVLDTTHKNFWEHEVRKI